MLINLHFRDTSCAQRQRNVVTIKAVWLTPCLLGSSGSVAGSAQTAAKTVLRASCRLQRKHCTPRGAPFGDAPPSRAPLSRTRSAAAELLAATLSRSVSPFTGQEGRAFGFNCNMELALIWSKAVSRTPGGTQMCAPEGPQLPAPTPPTTPRC